MVIAVKSCILEVQKLFTGERAQRRAGRKTYVPDPLNAFCYDLKIVVLIYASSAGYDAKTPRSVLFCAGGCLSHLIDGDKRITGAVVEW